MDTAIGARAATLQAEQIRRDAALGKRTPAEVEAAELQRQTQRILTTLDTYEDAGFDRTYLDTQVAQHEWLLTNLDGTLIPSARTPAMRTVLSDLRLAVSEHLRLARDLRVTLQ